jgi:hypothetical protein
MPLYQQLPAWEADNEALLSSLPHNVARFVTRYVYGQGDAQLAHLKTAKSPMFPHIVPGTFEFEDVTVHLTLKITE